LQPGIIVNRRGLGVGDFGTPECAFPKERISGWWEYCHIWNDGGWGYLHHETYKPIGWATSELAKARSWNGNFLLNISPNARGELPPVAYERFKELGQWLDIHREAIFDVEPGPWPEQSNVPVTVRSETWYLHVCFCADFPIVVTEVTLPRQAHWLSTGEEAVFKYEAGQITIDMPPGKPSVQGDVIALLW
jgi:alpha-L-fucosidase